MAEEKKNPGYLMFVRGEDWDKNLSAEEIQEAMEGMTAWFDKLFREGYVRDGAPLQPTGRIISAKKDGTVLDGPFVESKEAIGGFLAIDADDIETVVRLAKEDPVLRHGVTLEIRPLAEECPVEARMKQTLANAKG